MSARNGGSAFPNMPPLDADGRSATGYPYPESGMTLRDYFAAKAMQGLCTQPPEHFDSAQEVAEDAYSLADAMLKAREAK